MMRSLSVAFLVTLYIVCTQINSNVSSKYADEARSIFHESNFSVPQKSLLAVPEVNYTSESSGLGVKLLDALRDEDAVAKYCLENITNCYENDDQHVDDVKYLSKSLMSLAAPFDLTKTEGVSTKCKEHSRKYLEDFSKLKFWALQMYDATAKVAPGLLNGNLNQLGDFDVCFGSRNVEFDIYGQYCLASFQIEKPDSAYLSALYKLMHSHHHFRSQMDDPGHRVPRYSSINWGICVPDSCTAADIHLGIRETLSDLLRNTTLKIETQMDPSMCQTSRPKAFPTSTILAMSFFVGLALFVLFATFYDLIIIENANVYITAFSLKKNCSSMLTMRRKEDIQAVHGIRCLNSLLLILSHKSMAVFFVPFHNRTSMVEFVSKPWTVLARAASLYTDPFIMIAGTLTAHSLFGKLENGNKIKIKDEYINRLFRIVPTFAALIAFCTFVLPWINSGPMWNQVITHHSEICKQNWWRNMLFIHNYFGFDQMCLTHTHHVGIDTQLFLLSPFLILLLWKYKNKGLGILIALGLGSTVLRFYVTYTQGLSNYIHFGTSIQQLFRTADNMYILPVHRLTVYVMGILLGYCLRKLKKYKLSKSQVRIGNSVALLSFLGSFCGPSFMGSINYVYNPVDAACYAAFAPILWCISFGWIILYVHLGHDNVLGRFFSWPGFSLWTKISYTVYLTQFPIFFYNVGTTKSADYYSFWRTNFNVYETIAIVMASIVLSLLVEMPFQNIRTILLKSKLKNK